MELWFNHSHKKWPEARCCPSNHISCVHSFPCLSLVTIYPLLPLEYRLGFPYLWSWHRTRFIWAFRRTQNGWRKSAAQIRSFVGAYENPPHYRCWKRAHRQNQPRLRAPYSSQGQVLAFSLILWFKVFCDLVILVTWQKLGFDEVIYTVDLKKGEVKKGQSLLTK